MWGTTEGVICLLGRLLSRLLELRRSVVTKSTMNSKHLPLLNQFEFATGTRPLTVKKEQINVCFKGYNA